MLNRILLCGLVAILVAVVLVVPESQATVVAAPQLIDPNHLVMGLGLGFTVKELREKRKGLVEGAQALLEKIRKGEVPAEQRAEREKEVDKMLDDSDKLQTEIQREERADKAQKDLQNPTRERLIQDPELSGDAEENKKRYSRAFRSFLIHGGHDMPQEERAFMRAYMRDPNAGEKRTGQTVTTTGGGYLIPNDWVQAIEIAELAYGSVMAAPTSKWRTATGALIPYPTMDDTSNKGQLLGINTQESEQTFVLSVENFNAYKFTSKAVLIPIELLQDSAFDIDTFLQNALATRLGRIKEQYFTTGSGTSQPEGIVTGATSGLTITSPTAIAYNDLVDLKHSVGPAYRNPKTSGWMMHDTTLKLIRKLVDTQNRPLWEVSVQAGDPDLILGFPYYINQEMNTVDGSAKSLLYGDFSKYVIRTVTEMVLMRMTERYADYYQVGFQLFQRADARLVDAGTHPLKYAVHQSL